MTNPADHSVSDGALGRQDGQLRDELAEASLARYSETILANVREEIREEVAYAIELAKAVS